MQETDENWVGKSCLNGSGLRKLVFNLANTYPLYLVPTALTSVKMKANLLK